MQATGAEQNGYLTLISTLGISPLTKLRIADVSSRKLSSGLAQPAQKAISMALSRRPDVLAAYSAQKAALANVRAAEADFMPKVFMSGTGSYTNGNLYLTQVPAVGKTPDWRSPARATRRSGKSWCPTTHYEPVSRPMTQPAL